MNENLKKYLVEMVGTFFLVLTIACTALLGSNTVIAPLAIGTVLAVMVYAGGYVSGGHYNPAVSLAAAIKGALSWDQFLPYVLFQLIGSVLAVYAFNAMANDNILLVEPALFENASGLMLAEFLFTFALCYVVLMCAISKEVQGNQYYGFAIGSTVTVGAFAVGGTLCAGAFNPAVALSVGMLGVTSTAIVGMTILANLLGGICAACVFRFISAKNDDDE